MAPRTVRDIFEECQKGTRSHGKLIRSLTAVYNKTDLESFWEDFLHHMKYSLVIFKREPAVERTLDFVAKFATSLEALQREEKKKSNGEETAEENSQDEESEEEMHPFLLKLFTFFLQSHNAHDRAVRFRCCQMINKLLNSLGEDAQIDDDLYDKIYRGMLQRLRDIFPIVRMQAVSALVRLQDPTDVDCPVIKAYLFLVECDNNADVRRNVLSSLAVSTTTLPSILGRTRDVKDIVRKVAYEVIAEKVHIKALTIAQRVRLLEDGLNDRTEMVREACCGRLLQAWLQTFDVNILSLLQCLDVENSLKTTQLAVKALFKKVSVKELVSNLDLLNEDLLILPDELTCESVFYWRMLVQHIKSLGGAEAEEYLDKVLPNGKAFCDYVSGVLSRMERQTSMDQQLENEFILQQLLMLAGSLDMTDEVGRKELKKLVQGMLVCDHVSHTLVEALLARMQDLVTDQEARINELAEIISDIRQPITTVQHSLNSDELRKLEVKIAGVRVELNQTREELDSAVQQQDFERAAELKGKLSLLEQSKASLLDETQAAATATEEMRPERNDPQTLLKCQSIVCEMMQQLSLSHITPTLQTMVETLLIPGIQNEDPAVRNMAVKSLGLCCQLNREMSCAHLLLFVQISQVDQDTVRTTALQVIFDLLHTFGLEAFQLDQKTEDTSQLERPRNRSVCDVTTVTSFEEEEEENLSEITSCEDTSKTANKTASSLFSILISLLDSESSEIRTVAAEGLAKLLLAGRVSSAKLLSRLFLIWYNPITEDDQHLRHCLGTFFPVFAFAGRVNQELVEESMMPTLRTLFRAPATSPLAEVDVNNVAELLVQLTCSRHLITRAKKNFNINDAVIHDSIAVKVCNEILKDPNSFYVKVLCKTLTSLELSAASIKDLKVLVDNCLQEVKEKTCIKLIEKFKKTLEESDLSVSQVTEKSTEVDETASVEVKVNVTETASQVENRAVDPDPSSSQMDPTPATDTDLEADGYVTADESLPEKSLPCSQKASPEPHSDDRTLVEDTQVIPQPKADTNDSEETVEAQSCFSKEGTSVRSSKLSEDESLFSSQTTRTSPASSSDGLKQDDSLSSSLSTTASAATASQESVSHSQATTNTHDSDSENTPSPVQRTLRTRQASRDPTKKKLLDQIISAAESPTKQLSLSENKETSTPTPTRMTRSRRANTSSTETPSPAKQTRRGRATRNVLRGIDN